MNFLLWILASYGIAQIIVETDTFDWLKGIFLSFPLTSWVAELMECIICTSTWIGFIMSLFVFSPTAVYLQMTNIWASVFLDGMICSGTVWLIHALESRLLRK